MIIGKKLAVFISKKIAIKIASTTLYKQISKKLGLSVATSTTGIGIPISLLMLQGLLYRASQGSKRLKQESSDLWSELRAKDGLDMLYFLVEPLIKENLPNNFLQMSNKNFEKLETSKHVKSVIKHVIKTGDSLSKISIYYYGNKKFWPLIYSDNKSIIGPNPNLIIPGKILVIQSSTR